MLIRHGLADCVPVDPQHLAASLPPCIALPCLPQPLALPADIRAGAELLRSIAGPQYALAAVLEAYSGEWAGMSWEDNGNSVPKPAFLSDWSETLACICVPLISPLPHSPAAKLKRRQAALLRPANSGGGDADGADYAAALGQKLALSLQAAALDAEAVFWPSAGAAGGGGGGWSIGGSSVAALGAAFLAWALQETERWVMHAALICTAEIPSVAPPPSRPSLSDTTRPRPRAAAGPATCCASTPCCPLPRPRACTPSAAAPLPSRRTAPRWRRPRWACSCCPRCCGSCGRSPSKCCLGGPASWGRRCAGR